MLDLLDRPPPKANPESALVKACDSNDLDAVREAASTAEASDHSAGLCRACQKGNLAAVELLLQFPNVDVDATSEGNTPLFVAAKAAHPNILNLLLQNGADVTIKSSNGGVGQHHGRSTPLHGLLQQVFPRYDPTSTERWRASATVLLHAGCDVNAADHAGRTVLQDCLHYGLPLLDILLARGADPNAQSKDGSSPMHMFHHVLEHPEQLELLMSHGARLDSPRTTAGETPLHTYAKRNTLGDLSLFRPYVSDWNILDAKGNTLLHLAVGCYHTRSETVPKLLEIGLDPKQANNDGCQAIHMVGGSGDGFTKILDILCAAGSDLEARDFKGRTLLALTLSGSVSYNYAQLVPHLVSRGANLNTQDHNGNGVLHYMMQSHNVSSEHAEFLLSLGADPSMANHDGDTFLHCVAANIATVTGESGILIVRKLIQMGISPTIRNHKGQTPLHSLCSQVSQIYFNESVYPEATFVDLVLDTGLIAGLQIADRDGVLPIHLAATISESLVATLMSRGASTTAVTADGRNLLHIASTARQSNIIGLLLDHYAATGQTSIVNARCKNGRTPLHDACRSGRLETVTLLLAAGAEIDIADANNQTIFYACSAFTEEQRLWTFTNDSKNIFQTLLAGGVLSQDTTRPRVPTRTGKPERRSGLHVVESEHDTVDIGSIVRLLVTHGAKLDGGGREYRTSILDTAIRDGSDDVVVELERLRKKGLDLATRRPFESKYMRLRSDHLPALVDECINGHLSYYDLTHLILHGHSEEVIQALERNVETLRSKWDSASSALAEVLVIAARYGYTELFSRVGSLMSGSDWVNGARGALRAELIPYLLAASQRSLPNLEVIKVMVEKFHADVNVQFSVGAKMTPEVFFSSKTDANRQYKPDDTILHYLAKGGHWWHEGAIKYLLEHGANPNARDKQGKTPLCHAVCSRHLSPHRQTQLVKLFLEAGADPNIPAYCGFTPLAMAAHDNELVQLLIQHGARPSTEHPMELFSALANYNVKSLDSLLDMGLDCNTTVLSDAQPHWHTPRVRKTAGTPDYVLRPLDYISTEYFNDSYTRDNAIMMIRRLLERGADPYLPIDNKWLIIHAAFGHGGIIQPFLEMDNLDLERRDGEGRTLLLAAAFYRGGTNSYTYEISLLPSIEPRYKPRVYLEDDPSRARTLYERGADLTATDNKGNNVLHWLVQHQPGDKFQRMELEKTVALFLEKVPGLASQVNGEGKTPLDIATEKQHVWAIDILQSAAI